MTPTLEMEFLTSLRELCAYFEEKCVEKEKKQEKINGHHSNFFSSKTAYTTLCSLIGFNKSKFESTDILGFIRDSFLLLNKKDVIAANLHLSPESFCIFKLLGRFVTQNLSVFDKSTQFTIQEDELKQLIELQNKLMSPFYNITSQQRSSTSTSAVLDSAHNNANNHHPEMLGDGNDRSFDDKMRKIDNYLRNRDNNELIFLLNKIVRFRNHLAIAKIHTNNGTTPSSLFFNRFPKPFFPHVKDFIDKYNLIIENFQKETMQLIICTLNSELAQMEEKISDFKKNFVSKFPCSSFSFEDVVNQGLKIEEDRLNPIILKNKNRAERAEVHKLTVKTRLLDRQTPEASFNLSHNDSNASSINSSNLSRPNSSRRLVDSRHRYNHSKSRSNLSRPRSNYSRPRSNSRDFGYDEYNRNGSGFVNYYNRPYFNYRDRSRPSRPDMRHDVHNNNARVSNNYDYNDHHSRYINNNNNYNRNNNNNNSNYNNNNNATRNHLNREIRFSNPYG
jgi:hypothetical protein